MMILDKQEPEVGFRSTDSEAEATSPWFHPVVLTTVLIAVIGGAFLNTRSIGLDESISAGLGRGTWSAFYTGVAEDGGSQSLYFLLVRAFSFLGNDPWVIRLPALLAAMAVPYPLYRLIEPRFNRAIAARALLFLALSYTFVANAQEGRAYTVLTAVLTWTWFALDRALKSATLGAWLTVGVLAAVSLYAQPLGVPILIAMAVWVLLHRQQLVWKQFIAAGALAAVLAAPFVYLMLFEAVDHTEWLGTFTVKRFAELLMATLGSQDINAAMMLSLAGSGLVALLAAVAVLSVGRDRLSRERYREGTLLFFIWVAVPVLVLLAGSFSRAYFSARYAVPLVPPAMVLAAIGTEHLKRFDRRLTAVAFFAVAALLGARTLTGYGNEDVPWDELQEYVASQATPDDIVAFEPAYVQSPFEYYTYLDDEGDTMARPMEPAIGWTAPRHPNVEEYPDTPIAAPDGSLWVVLWSQNGIDEIDAIVDRADAEMIEVDRRAFGDGMVLRYEPRS